MSIPPRNLVDSFLSPLEGKSVIFTVNERVENLRLARFILSCLAVTGLEPLILDTSAFYGTHIAELAADLPARFLDQARLIQVPIRARVEETLVELITGKRRIIIIDDLNSILYLLSRDSRRSGMHKFFALFQMLSYEAIANNSSILGVAYERRDGPIAGVQLKRSLLGAADLMISARWDEDSLVFSSGETGLWPTGTLKATVSFRQ